MDPVLDAPTTITPAVAPAPAPPPPAAPAEPPSLRETLEAAVAKTPLTTEAPRDGTAEQTQRVRDGQGRFLKRNADGTEVPSEDQVRAAQPKLSLDPNVPLDEEGGEQTQREDPLPSTDNAPKSWKGVAKEKWAGVDPVIRAEVHRREREMSSRAMNETAPVKKFVDNFTQTINPFAQHYAQVNIPPLQLFHNLMQR